MRCPRVERIRERASNSAQQRLFLKVKVHARRSPLLLVHLPPPLPLLERVYLSHSTNSQIQSWATQFTTPDPTVRERETLHIPGVVVLVCISVCNKGFCFSACVCVLGVCVCVIVSPVLQSSTCGWGVSQLSPPTGIPTRSLVSVDTTHRSVTLRRRPVASVTVQETPGPTCKSCKPCKPLEVSLVSGKREKLTCQKLTRRFFLVGIKYLS